MSTPDRPITVNAFDPGLMPGTGLVRNYGPAVRLAWTVWGRSCVGSCGPFRPIFTTPTNPVEPWPGSCSILRLEST